MSGQWKVYPPNVRTEDAVRDLFTGDGDYFAWTLWNEHKTEVGLLVCADPSDLVLVDVDIQLLATLRVVRIKDGKKAISAPIPTNVHSEYILVPPGLAPMTASASPWTYVIYMPRPLKSVETEERLRRRAFSNAHRAVRC